jgi:hypothetical protein
VHNPYKHHAAADFRRIASVPDVKKRQYDRPLIAVIAG